MTPRETADFDRLVSDYCDGALSAERFAELEALLRASAELRRRFLELTAVHASLGWALAREPDAAPPEPARAPRRKRLPVALAALAAAVLLAVGAVALWPGAPVEAPAEVARLVDSGGAEVRDSRGAPVARTEALAAGQTLRTDAADGFAVLEVAGARLEVGPDAQLHVAEVGARTRLVLTAGFVRGTAGSAALVLQTPQAEVSPGSAKFVVSASADLTEVEAESGFVRLVRASDGRALDVPAGSSAVVSATGDAMELRAVAVQTKPRAEYKLAAHGGLAFADAGRALVVRMKFPGWTHIDLASGRTEQHRVPNAEGPLLTALADDGTFLSVSKTGRARLFAPTNTTARAEFDTGVAVSGLWAVSGNGARIAFARQVAGPGEKVRTWDVATGREGPALLSGRAPRALALSADGTRAAWAADGDRRNPAQLAVCDTATGKELCAVPVPERPVRELALSADGKLVAGATDHGAVFVWSVPSGEWVAGRGPADGWARPVRALAWSADGKHLAVGTTDGRARVWELATGREVALACGNPPVTALAFSPDGRTLATATNRGNAALWDLPTEP